MYVLRPPTYIGKVWFERSETSKSFMLGNPRVDYRAVSLRFIFRGLPKCKRSLAALSPRVLPFGCKRFASCCQRIMAVLGKQNSFVCSVIRRLINNHEPLPSPTIAAENTGNESKRIYVIV